MPPNKLRGRFEASVNLFNNFPEHIEEFHKFSKRHLHTAVASEAAFDTISFKMTIMSCEIKSSFVLPTTVPNGISKHG